MRTEELRAHQRPLKQQYRHAPETAVIRLHAEGSLDDEGVACSLSTGRGLIRAGLHPATGGDGAAACSGDLLLQALVACAGVTMRAVAINRGIDVTGTVRAEGVLDVRGTLGVDGDAAVAFEAIRLEFDLESEAPAENLAELVDTTERYCVVLQTLRGSPQVMCELLVGNRNGSRAI